MEKVAPVLLQGTSNTFSDNFLNGSSILQCHHPVGETMAFSKTTDSTLTSLILACEMWSTNPPWLLLFRAGLVTAAFLVVPVEVDFFLLTPVPVDISLTAQVLEKNVGLPCIKCCSFLLTLMTVRVELGSSLLYRGVDAKHLPPSLIKRMVVFTRSSILTNFLVPIASLHGQCRWILFEASSEVQHVE